MHRKKRHEEARPAPDPLIPAPVGSAQAMHSHGALRVQEKEPCAARLLQQHIPTIPQPRAVGKQTVIEVTMVLSGDGSTPKGDVDL